MKRLTNAEKAEIHKELEEAEKAKFKPYEKRIAELEAEVKEWKDKADLWCKTANLKDHNIMINKELEKENAELKEKVNILDNCDRLGDVITEAYKDQLTKAKELLKQWVELYKPKLEGYPITPIQEQTEQFLSEVEKCGQ